MWFTREGGGFAETAKPPPSPATSRTSQKPKGRRLERGENRYAARLGLAPRIIHLIGPQVGSPLSRVVFCSLGSLAALNQGLRRIPSWIGHTFVQLFELHKQIHIGAKTYLGKF